MAMYNDMSIICFIRLKVRAIRMINIIKESIGDMRFKTKRVFLHNLP